MPVLYRPSHIASDDRRQAPPETFSLRRLLTPGVANAVVFAVLLIGFARQAAQL